MKLSYSIKEAAAAIGVSDRSVKKYIFAGDITIFKLGARTLIRADALEGFIDRRSQPSPASAQPAS